MSSGTRFAALLIGLLAGPVSALDGFPPSVTLPADVLPYSGAPIVPEDHAEAEFVLPRGEKRRQQGRRWFSYLKWTDAKNRPLAETAPVWLAALKAGGWTHLATYNEGSYFTLRKQEGGKELWLRFALGDYDSPEIELIETGGSAGALQLPPPAAQPETVPAGADFPYLGKPEGSVLMGTGHFEQPLDVTVRGSDRETRLVGQGYAVKSYRPPASLSKLAFETQYRRALERAGWQLRPADGGKPGEGRVVAQYVRNGRNLWAVLGRGADNGSSGITLAVADLGAEDWSGALRRDCRLPLYGLSFDFNKASLKPESTPVLDKLQAVLAGDPALMVEVQGHTDNIGGAGYNQTLSEARARTVMDWLLAHGIPAARLASRGYGLQQPVADNGSEAGRARNRRVEIVRRGCTTP